MKQIRRLSSSIFVFVLFVCTGAAFGQKGALGIDYAVTLADPATQQFHIATDIDRRSTRQ